MADPFVAEVRIFPFNFAPKGWAFCDGQLLPLSQNTALFALLGTMYGGNGKSNFALPDFQGMAVRDAGQGPDGELVDQGEVGGSETVTLLTGEIPFHTHSMTVSAETGSTKAPTNAYLAKGSGVAMYGPVANTTNMSLNSLALAGGSLPHNNMQPYLTLNYCIALQGVFPPRG